MAVEQARHRTALWIVSACAAAVLIAGATLPRERPLGNLQLCALKAFTSIPCPSCGITRSIVEVCHGDVAGALRFHPLGPVLFAALVILVALPILPSSWCRTLGAISFSTKATMIAVAAILGTWAVRLAVGHGPP
jgi:hypothetical protein